MSNRAFVTLGSNIDPERNLVAAAGLLRSTSRVLKVSSVWESEPVGDRAQPRFCNAAVLIQTGLEARHLKRYVLRVIEETLGRVRDPDNRNGPRPIDLDLALFRDDVLDLDGSPVPDPEILTRPFLAVPLAELDPSFLHPVANRTLSVIANDLGGSRSLMLRDDVVLTENDGAASRSTG